MSIHSDTDELIRRCNRLKTNMEGFKSRFGRLLELSDLLILNAQETIALCESARRKLDTSPQDADLLLAGAIKAGKESERILEEYIRLWTDLSKPDTPWAV